LADDAGDRRRQPAQLVAPLGLGECSRRGLDVGLRTLGSMQRLAVGEVGGDVALPQSRLLLEDELPVGELGLAGGELRFGREMLTCRIVDGLDLREELAGGHLVARLEMERAYDAADQDREFGACRGLNDALKAHRLGCQQGAGQQEGKEQA
jgi:hypothetical protein